MTRKEFEVFRLSLEKEKFPKAISDPIDYGIQRTIFKREKLRKLITIGKNIRSRTVQAKIERWKRQLSKLEQSQAHLTELKQELDAARLTVTSPASRNVQVKPRVAVTPPAAVA
jgi:hypothetical protein